jgi:regulator of replication initiation timing
LLKITTLAQTPEFFVAFMGENHATNLVDSIKALSTKKSPPSGTINPQPAVKSGDTPAVVQETTTAAPAPVSCLDHIENAPLVGNDDALVADLHNRLYQLYDSRNDLVESIKSTQHEIRDLQRDMNRQMQQHLRARQQAELNRLQDRIRYSRAATQKKKKEICDVKRMMKQMGVPIPDYKEEDTVGSIAHPPEPTLAQHQRQQQLLMVKTGNNKSMVLGTSSNEVKKTQGRRRRRRNQTNAQVQNLVRHQMQTNENGMHHFVMSDQFPYVQQLNQMLVTGINENDAKAALLAVSGDVERAIAHVFRDN